MHFDLTQVLGTRPNKHSHLDSQSSDNDTSFPSFWGKVCGKICIVTAGFELKIYHQFNLKTLKSVDPLVQLKEKYQWLCLLQTIASITDYTCQFTQAALTVPQLIGHLSEETGIWLNSFNLTAGIIAISQIPTKKWIQSRLAETERAIARLQAEQ